MGAYGLTLLRLAWRWWWRGAVSAWCALACEPEHRQYQGGPTPEMAAWFVVCRKHGVLRMRRYGQTVWSTHTIPTRREPDLAEIYRR